MGRSFCNPPRRPCAPRTRATKRGRPDPPSFALALPLQQSINDCSPATCKGSATPARPYMRPKNPCNLKAHQYLPLRLRAVGNDCLLSARSSSVQPERKMSSSSESSTSPSGSSQLGENRSNSEKKGEGDAETHKRRKRLPFQHQWLPHLPPGADAASQ